MMADIKSGRVNAPVEIVGLKYAGATGADNARIMFRVPPYGSIGVDWAKIPPKALLTLSTSLIQSTLPDAADRQWFSAVFASSTGQADAARVLGEAAAKTKPEYREQLKLLSSVQP